MGKNKRARNPSKSDLSKTTDEESYINREIVVLGSILIIGLSILARQLGDVFFAYRDMKYEESSKSLQSGHVDDRKIAEINISPHFAVGEVVKAFVKRNEPFICRGCLNLRELSFWDNDDRLLDKAGLNASIQVRIAQRSENTLFRQQGTSDGKISAYEERSMLFSEFLEQYGNVSSEDVLYGAQIDIVNKLPSLLAPIQESGPPSSILEGLGTPPPISHRPFSMYIGHGMCFVFSFASCLCAFFFLTCWFLAARVPLKIGPLVTQTHYDSLENFGKSNRQ